MMDKVLQDIRMGIPVIIIDSHDRENEGDFMIAAEKADAALLSWMAFYGRGLMCLPCTADRLQRLDIPMMHSNKLDKFATPFANSIDAANGITTGMSIGDRLVTIRKFVDDTSLPTDFSQPGHLFPLRAHPQLLAGRRGHTEASVQLCILAGMKPVAVITEIMNVDGSMARVPDLKLFAYTWKLQIVTVDDIVKEVGNGQHRNASV
jgi:3,4-dihydroxy 2-butanone 4-phosphate synthase/GTP cyclohydrolase II